jgi:hypothetical protein
MPPPIMYNTQNFAAWRLQKSIRDLNECNLTIILYAYYNYLFRKIQIAYIQIVKFNKGTQKEFYV